MYFVAGSYPVEENKLLSAAHDLEAGAKSTDSSSGGGGGSEMVSIPPPRSPSGGSEKNELHKVAAPLNSTGERISLIVL
jgi:hypothetical protein